MASRIGGRARRLIITGVVAAGVGAGATGVALAATPGAAAAGTTLARTTSSSSSASTHPCPHMSGSAPAPGASSAS